MKANAPPPTPQASHSTYYPQNNSQFTQNAQNRSMPMHQSQAYSENEQSGSKSTNNDKENDLLKTFVKLLVSLVKCKVIDVPSKQIKTIFNKTFKTNFVDKDFEQDSESEISDSEEEKEENPIPLARSSSKESMEVEDPNAGFKTVVSSKTKRVRNQSLNSSKDSNDSSNGRNKAKLPKK